MDQNASFIRQALQYYKKGNTTREAVIFTNNGFQIHGQVLDFDDTAIIVSTDNGRNCSVVLLSNVSTIQMPTGWYQNQVRKS